MSVSNGCATQCERAEVFCWGLRCIFEWAGRSPRTLVLDNATEAGRMAFGKVTESRLFSQFRAHYRCESRYCNPYSGNEKGSVENAVGFLRRNLLVPVPEAPSLEALNAMLREGCERLNAQSVNRDGRPTAQAFQEDLAGMLELPGMLKSTPDLPIWARFLHQPGQYRSTSTGNGISRNRCLRPPSRGCLQAGPWSCRTFR